MKKVFTVTSMFIVVLIITNRSVHAQASEKCGTDIYMNYKVSQNPKLADELKSAEQTIQQWLLNNPYAKNGAGGGIDTIPVVIHVIYKTASQNISDAQVISQIDVLNEDFGRYNADTILTPVGFLDEAGSVPIRFCLAERDPDGNPTTGIERRETATTSFGADDNIKYYASGGLDAWDTEKYLNIWVGNLSGGLLGYGEFPVAAPSETFGVVVLYSAFGREGTVYAPFDLGRTCTHEFSHCFNLYHIWGDDGGSCGGSDAVADTPNQADATFGCPGYPEFDGCAPSGDGIMFMNYMDYSDDVCMNMFTQGQSDRMIAALESFYPELFESDGCVPVVLQADDAGIPLVSSPEGVFCETTITPVIELKNWGFNTLTTVTISYQVDAGVVYEYIWTGSLASLSSIEITLPEISVSEGDHILNVYTTLPNGFEDLNVINDADDIAFSTVFTGGLLPVFEGFESVTFPPAGWNVVNTGGITWERTTAADKTGVASAFIDNYNYDAIGDEDDVESKHVDLTGLVSPYLKFYVAYAYYKQGAQEYMDALEILISTDCSNTYTSLYYKEGEDLETAPPTSSPFDPTAAQWRQDSVDLSSYVGNENVTIIFRNITGYGNNLYLDDINIDESDTINIAINNIENTLNYIIYPNPADQFINIENNNQPITYFKITNVTGQIIYSANKINADNLTKINISGLSNGVYYLSATINDQIIANKFIVQHN